MNETEMKPPVHSVHHHPAVKWVLMVAMLAVVGLGLPRPVSAAAPSVQPPTGPQSGGVFSGVFTFIYYMNCSNGASYNSSYSSNLDGTNTFAFYGSADGSLLLSIDGGGQQLLSSCGDPYTGVSLVVSYTVSKNTGPPPTPTPTATPTPTPTATPHSTPTPTPGGGGITGGGTGTGSTGSTTGKSTGGSGAVAVPGQSNGSTGATATPAAGTPATGETGSTTTPATPTTTSGGHSASRVAGAGPSTVMRIAWLVFGALLLALLALVFWAARQQIWRQRAGSAVRAVKWRLEPYWFRVQRFIRFRHGQDEDRRSGLSRHGFSGRVLAHHHTSYPALAFLLLATTVLLASAGFTSHAADSTLSLFVAGPPPTTGADITDPLDGASVSTAIITVRGTCGPGLRVEITRNGDFAGSTICDNGGLYSLVMSLVDGTNLLRAADYDGADQPGPVTSPVTTTYIAPSTPTPTPTPTTTPSPTHSPTPGPTASPGGGHATPTPSPTKSPKVTPPAATSPLIITSDRHYYAGLSVGSDFSWPINVSGGHPPYSLTINWGDNTTSKPTLAVAGAVAPHHVYSAAGFYHVEFMVSDNTKRQAVLSVIAVVSGTTAAPTTTRPPHNDSASTVAWPILIGTSLVVLSFWLGERDRLDRVRPASAPSFGPAN